MLLKIADAFLHLLHFAVIISDLFFWWSQRTLRISQVTLVLTLISWVILGAVYGWGYCFLTDWQWRVKEALGERDLPNSYIQYILEKLSFTPPSELVDRVVLVLFVVSILGCGLQTWRTQSKK